MAGMQFSYQGLGEVWACGALSQRVCAAECSGVRYGEEVGARLWKALNVRQSRRVCALLGRCPEPAVCARGLRDAPYHARSSLGPIQKLGPHIGPWPMQFCGEFLVLG